MCVRVGGCDICLSTRQNKDGHFEWTSSVNDDRITGRCVLAHAAERTINLDLTHNGLLGTETLNPNTIPETLNPKP